MPENSGILAGGGEELGKGDDDQLPQRHHARLVHLLPAIIVYVQCTRCSIVDPEYCKIIF
jgi:hypothetical protein